MTDDTFDRLLANRVEIAEFVNSFASDKVQRMAFQVLAGSLGLAEVAAPGDPMADLAPAEASGSGDEAEPAKTENDSTGEATGGPRRRKTRGSSKKTFTVPRGLNFAPDGKPTFDSFIADKQPRNNHEKFLVACYYLSETMEVAAVDVSHILAAFQAAKWQPPAHPDSAIRSTASLHGWLDTSNTKSIQVVWAGKNFVENQMPSNSTRKKSR